MRRPQCVRLPLPHPRSTTPTSLPPSRLRASPHFSTYACVRASEISTLGFPSFPVTGSKPSRAISRGRRRRTGKTDENETNSVPTNSDSQLQLTRLEIPIETLTEAGPELLAALHEMATLVEGKTGFDMRKGQLPDFMDMLKLRQTMTDPELNAASERVKLELKKAGVDLEDQQLRMTEEEEDQVDNSSGGGERETTHWDRILDGSWNVKASTIDEGEEKDEAYEDDDDKRREEEEEDEDEGKRRS